MTFLPTYTVNIAGTQEVPARVHFVTSGCPLGDDRVALKEQIKQANDIVDVVGSYISLRPVGPTFKGVCPFHDDHRPSFDVDPRRQRYRCWACNNYGDVIKFVQEYEHVGFQEALELLARRAGISLDSLKKSPHGPSRGLMLDVVRWASDRFQECLLEAPEAEVARVYLGERRLTGETVRRFGLGYAPEQWEWLVKKAHQAKMPLDILETVGLVARRNEADGHYDRFRDRVIFPIRDLRGQTVGFGGRILPSSPLSAKAPKYYNSSETPLFSKSEQLYGIDHARQAATKAGWLAVVEGYTDVLMAHQHGVANVVATMGTALNGRHIHKLRGVVQRVVLVFDADAGGDTGVDRALDVFVQNEMELRVAALPEGLDPCDLLVAQGAAPFQQALESAVDVFEYKLARVWKESQAGVEEQRRAVEQMLGILSATPQERSVKLELMVNRIAHRLHLKEETVWTRLRELRQKRGDRPDRRVEAVRPPQGEANEKAVSERSATDGATATAPPMPAAPHERDLLAVLLADGSLIAGLIERLPPASLEHPRLRLLLEGLYRLHAEGLQPDLDHLRTRLDNERLIEKAEELRERGLVIRDRARCLEDSLAKFREVSDRRRNEELKNQAHGVADHAAGRRLLEQLRK